MTPASPLASDGPRPRARDGVVLAVLAFALYVPLGQTTLHYIDGHRLLERLADPSLPIHRHHLGVLLDRLAAGVLAMAGVPAHRAVTLLAALGTAAGVWLCHVGYARSGMRRVEAALAAAIVATCAPLIFFATVVEYHGLYFAFAQLAFVAAVAVTRRPTVVGATGLGLLCALATHAHASGALLTIALGAWLVGCRWHVPASRRRDSGVALVALTTHGLATVLGFAAIRSLGLGQAPTEGATLSMAAVVELLSWFGHAPRTAWEEWLCPYLPLSLVCLAAARPRSLRGPFAAFLVGLAAYLSLCVLIVAFSERGAYLAPIAALAAPLAVRSVPSGVSVATVAIGLALGIVQVREHDDQGPAYRAFTQGVRAVAAGSTPLLLAVQPLAPYDRQGSVDEVGACLVTDPGIDVLNITYWAQTPTEQLLPRLASLPDLLRARGRGRAPLLLSDGAIERLEDRAQCPSGNLVVAAIRAAYDLEPVRAPGFTGFALHER